MPARVSRCSCEVEVQSCEITHGATPATGGAHATDASGEVMLRFRHFYPSQQALLAEGARLRAFGEVRSGLLLGLR
jgi:ATP-dependent DNA helicase RecG